MFYLDYYKDKYYIVASLNGSLFIRTFLEVWANKANDALHNFPAVYDQNEARWRSFRINAFNSLNLSYPLVALMEKKLLQTPEAFKITPQRKKFLFRLYLILYPLLFLINFKYFIINLNSFILV